MYDDQLYNFNLLKLPHLTMLFTREVNVQALESESEWSDVDSSDSDTDSEPFSEKRPKRDTITVVDRLYDNGSKLNQLGICFDFEAHWVSWEARSSIEYEANPIRNNSLPTCQICKT
jgi:hypothetical protein